MTNRRYFCNVVDVSKSERTKRKRQIMNDYDDYKNTDDLCTNSIRVEADNVVYSSDDGVVVHDDEFSVAVQFDDEGEPDRDLYDDETWSEIVEDKDIPEDFKRNERKPVNWCNGAGVRVGENSVNVWVSIGDPRGALGLRVTKTENGELLIEVPTEEEMHVKLERKSEGMLRVVRD